MAVLWQAGFRNATCALGSHLNARQLRQLCDGVPRTVLSFAKNRSDGRPCSIIALANEMNRLKGAS